MGPKRGKARWPRGALTTKKARALLAKHQKLERILTNLEQKATNGAMNLQHFISQLAAARACIPAKDEYISQKDLNLLCPESCPPHARGLAQTVFNVPELLESILKPLGIADLLVVQCVNRQFRDAVNASTALQRKMSLMPTSSQHLYAPFSDEDMPRFYCGVGQKGSVRVVKDEQGHLRMVDGNNFMIETELSKPYPRIGSRCRRMQLVQPPIKEIVVFILCCGKKDHMIRSTSGITVGLLFDTTRRLNKEHRQCPLAKPHHLDRDGNVFDSIAFEARIELLSDDPTVQHFEKRAVEADMEGRKNWEKDIMMQEFIDARRQAQQRGEKVPILAEWKETYVPPIDLKKTWDAASVSDSDGE